MPNILATVIEIFITTLVIVGFLEQLKILSPFFAMILGFLFGVSDFIISYYWGWGIMARLEEFLCWIDNQF